MSSNNFKCNNCSKSFFVSSYSHGFRNGKLVLIGEYQCYHCKSYDTEELPKPKRNYNIKKGEEHLNFYGKFSSASDEKKREILTKRANEHYNKQGKEQKREMFKSTMRKMSQ